MNLTNISTIMIDEKDEIIQMPIRVPSGIKSFLEGKALELGYTTNGYVVEVFKKLMEQEYE